MFSPDTPFIKRRKYDHYKSPLGKRGLQYSVEPRNVRARTFEEPEPVTMPVYGKSGSDWTGSRRSVVTVSKDTLAKRVAKEETFYIQRMIKMNEFDAPVGYNKLEFNHDTGRLPVWLCDLTDFDNITTNMQAGGGVSNTYTINHGCAPWYVLNFKQTDVSHNVAALPGAVDADACLHEERKALFFDQLNYRYETELSTIGTSDGSGNVFLPSAIPYPPTIVQNGGVSTTQFDGLIAGKSPMLKWIDFRGMFYGVKSREVEWTISVVQFAKDYLDPVPNEKLNYNTASLGDDKVRERFQFWYKTAKKLTAHPLLPKTMGDYNGEKGVRYLAKYKFKVRESLTDADQINKVEKRINLRLNKILRKKWQYDHSSHNAYSVGDVYGDGKGLDDPMSKNAISIRECSRIHPRSRVYLMISATCPKSNLENADKVTNVVSGAVVDPTKVRNVTYEVPFKYTDAGFNNSEWIGGTNDVSATIEPVTIKLPGTGLGGMSSITNYVQQIDEADLVANTGKNALRVETSTGDTYTDTRGRLHIGANVLRGPDGSDTSATIAQLARFTEVVDDPGRDNPTFDFILRMKYVI